MVAFHRTLLCRVALLAVGAIGAGCGSDKNASQQEAPAPRDARSAPEPAGEVDLPKEPRQTGTLSGTVVFQGDAVPQETLIPIQTDSDYCRRHGKEGTYPKEDCLIDPDSRGIRNVIVYLQGEALRDWPSAAPQNIAIDNRNCRFEPHVNVSIVDSSVEVKNSDEIYHTTHLYGPPGFREFNPGMRTKGDSEKTILNRPGIYLVKCDRHGWMSAFLRVDRHPFQAVTGVKGHFQISGIPPGTYRVGMFHERFRPEPQDPKATQVTIHADETILVELELSE